MGTNFPDGVSSYGAPVAAPGVPVVRGHYWFVDAASGNDAFDGKAPATAVKTIQKAVNLASAYDCIVVAEGSYDETVTVLYTKNNLTFVGQGGRGAAAIAPSGAAATGLEVRADDVTLLNLGVAGDDTAAYGLRVFGSRFRAYGCKFEGNSGAAVVAVKLGPGTAAQINASPRTHGKGADSLFYDCEVCWANKGIELISSDYGACTQARILKCKFHNIDGTEVLATDTGGSNICVRNAWVEDCYFGNMEDGTKPADYLALNITNDTGMVTGCRFAIATNAAADLKIATKVFWVGNFTEAGVSAARPA